MNANMEIRHLPISVLQANAVQLNQRVQSRRVDFKADQPFQHHLVELELESSLAKGEIGQASWLTLPLTLIIILTLLQWEKVIAGLYLFIPISLSLEGNKAFFSPNLSLSPTVWKNNWVSVS